MPAGLHQLISIGRERRPDYLRKAQAERELEEAKRQGKVKELAAGHSVGTGKENLGNEAEVNP